MSPHRIGLVADTHGLVRPQLHDLLDGVELILHAGDVGGGHVLRELELIAPVRAVYGNTDVPGDPELSREHVEEIGGVSVHVSHGHEVGSPTPEKLLARYVEQILVFGHTHKPLVVEAEGRLVVNPGAAGPRRFDLHPSVAVLTIEDQIPGVELLSIESVV